MTVASRAAMMAVMTEARTTDVEQTSHWVKVKGGAVLTSRVVAVEESPAPIILHIFVGKAITHMIFEYMYYVQRAFLDGRRGSVNVVFISLILFCFVSWFTTIGL